MTTFASLRNQLNLFITLKVLFSYSAVTCGAMVKLIKRSGVALSALKVNIVFKAIANQK